MAARKQKVKKTVKRTITPGEGLSVIPYEKAKSYEVNKIKTKSGMKRVVDNGDPVAVRLRGKDEDELREIANKAGLGDRLPKWKHLNLGMFRMNLGNSLRGLENQKQKKKDAKAERASA